MQTSITSNELFHFTNKFENIIGIIKYGFQPRYNVEFTFLSNQFQRRAQLAAIPMICFCDLPLEMTTQHSTKYGGYAIGLSKTWGIKNCLSPVTYVNEESTLGTSYCALVNAFNDYHSSLVEDINVVKMIGSALNTIYKLSCFLKPYERLEVKHIQLENVIHTFPAGRFYDEREWRYIPDIPELSELLTIPLSHFKDTVKTQHYNERIKAYSLAFELKDISYILYKHHSELELLITALREKYNCTTEEIRNSCTLLLADS